MRDEPRASPRDTVPRHHRGHQTASKSDDFGRASVASTRSTRTAARRRGTSSWARQGRPAYPRRDRRRRWPSAAGCMSTTRPRVDVWMGKDRAEGHGVSDRSERARGAGLARWPRTSRIDLVRHDVGLSLEDRLVIHDHLRSCRPCGGGQQQGGRAQQKYDIEREWGLAGRMTGWFPAARRRYEVIEGFGEASECK